MTQFIKIIIIFWIRVIWKIFIFIQITISKAQSRVSPFSEGKTTPAGAESRRVSVDDSTIISYGKSFFKEGSGLWISMSTTPT